MNVLTYFFTRNVPAACATCLQPHWLLPVETTVLTKVLATELTTDRLNVRLSGNYFVFFLK